MTTCNGDTHTLENAIKWHETSGTHIESKQTPFQVTRCGAFIREGLLHLVQATGNVEIQWIHTVPVLATAARHSVIVVGDLQIILGTIAATARVLKTAERTSIKQWTDGNLCNLDLTVIWVVSMLPGFVCSRCQRSSTLFRAYFLKTSGGVRTMYATISPSNTNKKVTYCNENSRFQ